MLNACIVILSSLKLSYFNNLFSGVFLSLQTNLKEKKHSLGRSCVFMSQCNQTRQRSGSGSSRSDGGWWRTEIDEWEASWSQRKVRASVITISPSNTQSRRSMAPNWPSALSSSRASWGTLGAFTEKGMCLGQLLWLFTLVHAASEGTSVILDDSGKVLPPLCVDTMKCVLEAKILEPLSALW